MNSQSVLERRVASAIPQLFASHGIGAIVEAGQPRRERAPVTWCRLALDGRELRIAVDVKSRWSQAILDQIGSIANHGEDPRLLVLPKLSSVVRSHLVSALANI